jgi:hypothetical protein
MKHPDWPICFSSIHTLKFSAIRAGALGLIIGLAGCDFKAAPELVENGYPTLARVEYVLQCMEKQGKQNLDSLYPCVCSIDKIAIQMPYDDFAEAQTFTFMRSAPGEAGGLFRDPPRAAELRKQLEDAEAFAHKNCFVKPDAAGKS